MRRERNRSGVWMAGAAWALMAAAGHAAPSSVDDVKGPPAVTPQDENEGLPFVDVRRNADFTTSPMTARVLDAYKASPAWTKRQQAADALRAEIPGVRISDDAWYGTPAFVVCTSRLLTPPAKLAPREVAKAFVAAHADLFGIGPADLDACRMSRDFDSSGGLMHHMTFQQTLGGIDVYNATMVASTSDRGELITIGGRIFPLPSAIATHQMDEAAALRAAAMHCGVTITTMPTPREAVGPARHRHWNNSDDFGNGYDIETKMVYFAKSRTEVVPAWWVIVPVKGLGNQYETIVDARTGELLFRNNLTVWDTTQPATYRVYPLDSPAPFSPGPATPAGQQAPEVPRQSLTIQPGAIAPFSPNGWINDGDNRTIGNNVDAYNDSGNTNAGTDITRATGTAAPARVFDFPVDLTLAPSSYGPAVVTNLFYHANKYHDKLFALGFDEAASNYQTINFSGQGIGNDAVHAEAQDGSGTNNANWSSQGADGSTGRTQMYIFTGSNPDRDGSFDSDVVDHELTHGVSIRLHNGLTGGQSRCMGEGWGDFFGTCLNAEATDDFNGIYTTGGYITLGFPGGNFNNNYYYGIRRFPYSTDLTKNPYTYADIDGGQYAFTASTAPSTVIDSSAGSASEVHNAGEVWCNTLLECRASMGLDEGFAANNIIMQLAIDGMKLAPDNNPNFLQERDGIVAADLVRYGGAHQFRLWQAFAKRGMGEGATSNADSNTGVHEDFTLPQRVDFSFPAGTPEQVGATAPTVFEVDAAPFNLTITPGPGTLFYSVDNSAFTAVPMPQIGDGRYMASLPATPCFSTVRYYVSVPTNFGAQTGPRNAPAGFFSALTFTSTTFFVNDDFETASGWTVTNTAVGGTFIGAWERADPEPTLNAGLAMQPGDDHTADPAHFCYVTGALAGASAVSNDIDNGFTLLTSPTYNLSATPLAVIDYWRWWVTFAAGATGHVDTFTFEGSNNNGATWVVLDKINLGDPIVNAWEHRTVTLGATTLPTSAQMKFRFRAEDLNQPGGNIAEGAVDDFRIFRYECVAAPACDPDFNQDGNVDQDDVRYLISVVAGGSNPSGRDPDFNGDGNVDQDDVRALVNVVAGGNCP